MQYSAQFRKKTFFKLVFFSETLERVKYFKSEGAKQAYLSIQNQWESFFLDSTFNRFTINHF